MALIEHSVLWYAKKLGREDVTVSCGGFPNVPLIGTRGCINYNLMLAIRQLGYPMLEKPDDEALKEFVLHDTGINDPNMLQRIIRSWEVVHKKGNELRKRGSEIKEPYPQWVKERVKNIKLPFLIVPSAQPSSSEPIPISIEEVNELKKTISRLEKEKEGIENDLYQVSYERNKLKFNLNKERKRLKRTEEMAKEEKGKKEQVGDCVRGATEEARKHTYL
jgi:hypothetical protein